MICRHSSAPGRCDLLMPRQCADSQPKKKDAVGLSLTIFVQEVNVAQGLMCKKKILGGWRGGVGGSNRGEDSIRVTWFGA